MKRLLFLFVFFASVSCYQIKTDESGVFEPSQDSLYTQCRALDGIGDYKVGKTTFKNFLVMTGHKEYLDFVREISKTSVHQPKLDNDPNNFCSQTWGVKDDDIAHFIEKKKIIRQMRGPYHIKGIEFTTFDAAFIHDTLCAVYFVPKDDAEVLEHFKATYGDGRGSFTKNVKGKLNGKAYFQIHEEFRKWENERYMMDYTKVENFTIYKGNLLHEKKNCHYYLVCDKEMYQRFTDTRDALIKEYKDRKIAQHQDALNSL